MSSAIVPAFRSKLIVDVDGGFPYTLYQPLVYDSAVLARTITVPANFKTDFFSIPPIPLLRALLPKSEKGDPASVVHDALYQWGAVAPYDIADDDISRAQADAVLREAMEVCGVARWRRSLIWVGVRAGGWSPWGEYRRAERP